MARPPDYEAALQDLYATIYRLGYRHATYGTSIDPHDIADLMHHFRLRYPHESKLAALETITHTTA